jgi:5-methylcytosine-specific restriction endonuclease McrA
LKEVLVLGAHFLPLGRCDLEKAICLIYLGKAEIVKKSPTKTINSISSSWQIPEVIRLPDISLVRNEKLHPTKNNILKRDNYKCLYCGGKADTIDHVIPRSRFKQIAEKRNLAHTVNAWENVCAACKPCNSYKDQYTLEELGWEYPELKPMYSNFTIDWNSIYGE